MGDDEKNLPPTRKSIPTPYIEHDDTVVMIDPTALTRMACIDASMDLGMRPVSTSSDAAPRVIATTRPFVIVVEPSSGLCASTLTDLAVSVGAQLVFVGEVDVGPALAERVKLAGRAAKALRSQRKTLR